MERNTPKTRKPEDILNEAQSYFDKLGLTVKMDDYFGTDLVKQTIHQTYEKYENTIRGLVSDMPAVMKKRADEIIDEVIGREDAFIADVRANLMCNIVRLIKTLEDFVPVDEAITNLFVKAFTDEADGKMLEMVKYFAEGISNELLNDFIKFVSVPTDIPAEVAGLIYAMTGGKGIAMNLEEFMDFMTDDSGDECGDEKHQEECPYGECGGKCQCSGRGNCEENGCIHEDEEE